MGLLRDFHPIPLKGTGQLLQSFGMWTLASLSRHPTLGGFEGCFEFLPSSVAQVSYLELVHCANFFHGSSV